MIPLTAFLLRTILRGRWSATALVAFGAVSGVVALLGLGSFRELGLRAVGPAAVAFLNLALLLPTAQAVLLGALTVSTDRETGFFAMVRARGLGPGAVVGAAWLAVTVAAGLVLAAGFGTVALVLAGNVPTEELATFVALFAAMLGVTATAAAIGTLVGVVVRTRLQAALAALAAWFFLAIGLDLVVIGLGAFLRAGEPALIGAIVLNPFQAGRILGLLLIDGTASVLGPLGAYLLGRLGQTGAAGLLAAALGLWAIVPLAVARTWLARRD
jgi:ABC-type transport system involved in multi-copper enzyme maturation permease subunit